MDALRMVDQLGLREWAERNIYIPHDYQSYGKGAMYRCDEYPMLWAIMELLDVPTVREAVLIKSVQFGLSQNILIPFAMRSLHRGNPALFATGMADQAETFRLERFLPLVRSSPAFSALTVKDRETELYLTNGGMLSFLHNTSRSKTKSRPAKDVYADEADMFEWGVMERLRGRVTRYADSKIVIVSALDPDAKRKKVNDQTVTPALLEWNDSSRGFYYLPDPVLPDGHRDKWFKLEFGFSTGGPVPPFGVKWDHAGAKRADGTIDHQRIYDTARYVTPGGTTLTDDDLSRLMYAGRLIHDVPEQATIKPGMMINCLYTPKKRLADWVISYLRAKRMGGAEYRVWMLEKMCELPWLEKIDITDRSLSILEGAYTRGAAWYEAEKYLAACHTSEQTRGPKS
jgi:hypothetical protein